MVNKKQDIVRRLTETNRVFGGYPSQKSNLDFEADMASQSKKPLVRMAHLTRAMTAGHAFTDGNKRTAVVATTNEMQRAGFRADKRKLVKTILGFAKKEEVDLNKIQRKLRRCIKK